jgi:hypothetical protein
MKRLAILLLLLSACSTTPPASDSAAAASAGSPPTAARGLSCESAIRVADEAAAKKYVSENYPGSMWHGATNTTCNGAAAQDATVMAANGAMVHLYFVIGK